MISINRIAYWIVQLGYWIDPQCNMTNWEDTDIDQNGDEGVYFPMVYTGPKRFWHTDPNITSEEPTGSRW